MKKRYFLCALGILFVPVVLAICLGAYGKKKTEEERLECQGLQACAEQYSNKRMPTGTSSDIEDDVDLRKFRDVKHLKLWHGAFNMSRDRVVYVQNKPREISVARDTTGRLTMFSAGDQCTVTKGSIVIALNKEETNYRMRVELPGQSGLEKICPGVIFNMSHADFDAEIKARETQRETGACLKDGQSSNIVDTPFMNADVTSQVLLGKSGGKTVALPCGVTKRWDLVEAENHQPRARYRNTGICLISAHGSEALVGCAGSRCLIRATNPDSSDGTCQDGTYFYVPLKEIF